MSTIITQPAAIPTPPLSVKKSVLQSLLVVVLIFTGYTLFLVLFALHRLPFSEGSTFPHTLDDWKQIALQWRGFAQESFISASIFYVALYIFLQTFAIPGSFMLSIIGGYLFGLPVGLLYVCLCSATGASYCYLLSALVASKPVQLYFGDRMELWNERVSQERQHLANYIFFLRITPFLPNWFINIASPHLNIPLRSFYLGTFFGVSAPAFVHVQGGQALLNLTSTRDLMTPMNIIALMVIAVLSIVPVLYSKMRQNVHKDEEVDTSADVPLTLEQGVHARQEGVQAAEEGRNYGTL